MTATHTLIPTHTNLPDEVTQALGNKLVAYIIIDWHERDGDSGLLSNLVDIGIITPDQASLHGEQLYSFVDYLISTAQATLA